MRGEPKADATTRSGVRTFWLPTHPVIITRHYLVTHLKAAKGTITRLISKFAYMSKYIYESFATVGEIRVWWRADFQSGSRVLKKVF